MTALRNGLRAGMGVAIAGLFWIVSRWSDGGTMLALLGPICALISQTESAARSSVQFMWGTMLAGIAALVCSYLLLPQTDGSPAADGGRCRLSWSPASCSAVRRAMA